jgi:hypothetical protein
MVKLLLGLESHLHREVGAADRSGADLEDSSMNRRHPPKAILGDARLTSHLWTELRAAKRRSQSGRRVVSRL